MTENNFGELMDVERDNVENVDEHCRAERIDKEDVGNIFEQMPIHIACIVGLVDVVQMLLDTGSEIEAADQGGWRPIHFACRNEHAEIVTILLKGGCEIEAAAKDAWRPIHFACWNGHAEIVKILLKRGCEIEVADQDGWRPIHWACHNGHGEIVKILLKRGCEIEAAEKDGCRPIHWACWYGHAEIVKILLERGCEIEAADEDGRRPIHWACWCGYAEIVKILLKRVCEIESADEIGWRPIHFACDDGNAEIVQLLLNEGCVADAKTKDGKTPYDLAKYSGNSDCTKWIKKDQDERKTNEFQILHLPTFSIVSRKYKIWDLTNAVEKIKTEIPCINRPVVVCHLTDPLRRLAPSQKAFRMVSDELQYAEYFVEDTFENMDWQSRIANLREWNVLVAVNASDLEINLQINKQVDPSKWSQHTTVRFELLNKQSQRGIDTVDMVVTGGTTAAEVKAVFVDFQRFAYCVELFGKFDGDQTGSHCHIGLLNKFITTRKEMLTFYDGNGEKLSDSDPMPAKVSVVQKLPKEIKFIPSYPEAQWTKESISKLVSQEHMLIQCVTDDELAWAVLRNECRTIADVENGLRSSVLNDNKGRLMLVGACGQLSGDAEIDKLDSVIHYAVVLPYEHVKKMEYIGRGSYGTISKCQIGNEEKMWTMKEMIFLETESDGDKKSRINEVIVNARIGSHPNVEKYRRFFEDGCSFYIIMDCVKESLDAHIKRSGSLEEAVIISFARQILEGLKHLHDQKVIHRDIKCENILVDEKGCVKLCDFGIYKCQNVDTSKAAAEGGNTQIGTHRYMAPELLSLDRPETYSQKTDVWQFGLVMVKMISGKEPYPGLTDPQVHNRIENDKRVEYEFRPGFKKELKEFVDSCLAYDPKDRPTCSKLLTSITFHTTTDASANKI